MRKVFLDDLPRWGKGGKAKEGTINWNECCGMKVKFIYDEIEGEIEIISYDTEKQTLSVIFEGKNSFILTGSLQKCRIGNLLGLIKKGFHINIGDIVEDDKRDLSVINREYRKNKSGDNRKWIKYHCNKCTYEGWIVEVELLKGKGCPCCSVPIKKVVLGINTIWDVNREWVEKFGISKEDAQKYTSGSKAKINVRCPDCKKVKEVVISGLASKKSMGCSCGDGFSNGHKYVREFLSQLNLNFVDNYRPNWCKYYNEYKKKNSLKNTCLNKSFSLRFFLPIFRFSFFYKKFNPHKIWGPWYRNCF